MDSDVLSYKFNGPDFVAVIRNAACTIAGLVGFITQIQREIPDIKVLGLCMLCLGVPGISGGAILRRFFMDLSASQSQSDVSPRSQSMD